MTTAQVTRTEQDLVSVLLDAHACGRRILDAARRVLEEGATDDLVTRVATMVHSFVTLANPLHELDEEQRVFPALRAYGPKDEVDAALTYVVDEHIAFDDLRDRLAMRWAHVAETPACLGPLREDLLQMTEQLIHSLGRHAEHEELVIFPLVRKYVPVEVQAKILAVISNREGMGPDVGGSVNLDRVSG